MLKFLFTSCFVSVLLTLVSLAAGTPTSTDYCSPGLCSGGRRHIGCNNTGSFAPECPEGQTEMITMTPDLIEKILINHNSKRQLIASGNLSDFEPAAKMSFMQWDDELAQLAELNVKRCVLKHDYCHNTLKFKQSGQNLAKMWWKGGSYTDEDIILSRIDTWWLEYKNTNMSQLAAYPRYSEKMIGHFTVMTAEKNSFVGCGAVKSPDNGMSSLTLACNYAATNLMGMPMYTPGSPASKCLLGARTDFPALCQ